MEGVAAMGPAAVPFQRRLVALPRTTSATYRKLHRLQAQLDLALGRRHRGWELVTTLTTLTTPTSWFFFYLFSVCP